MSDKLQDLICPQCGHNLLDNRFDDWNPRKRLTLLQLERDNELMRLIRKVVHMIKKNVPSAKR